MISADNLTKGYSGNILLDRITFKLNSRERVGLVGRNGHGKTTLFRLIAGEEEADGGSIIIPRHYRIGYVKQHIQFTEDTILEEGMRGLPADESDHHWKVERVLSGLGFTEADTGRHPREFSGGFQVRLNLAKVLVSEPDLLLLDEPTNYLDITSIRWVIRFLNQWPRELLLITHDRGFMDKVVTHTLGIHRQKTRKMPGTTEKYYLQIAQEEEVYEKTRINDEKRRKEIEQFVTRFRAKARLANLVQSRIKTLSKMEKRDKLEKLKTLDFTFQNRPFAAKQVLSADHVSFAYDPSSRLISDFGLTIGAGDRICVVGKNGKGKTTLLRLLAGKLEPQGGRIAYHPKATRGFFEQTNIESLVDTRTVEEEILYAGPEVDRQTARNICGAMMFEGDSALKRIAVLSGGEKSRVMLGKLLVTPVNLLLLDEPTNHLDMESTDAMMAAVDNFDGAVVMVTHNEMFLHTLAERLVVFQDEELFVFEGTYQDFLEKGGWKDEPGSHRLGPKEKHDPADDVPGVAGARPTRKERRRTRSASARERARALKPIEQDIHRMEAMIEAQEKEIERKNDAMLAASRAQDGALIAALAKEIHHGRQSVDKHYDELERLTRLAEEKRADLGLK